MNPDISDSEAQPTANAVSLFGSSGGVNDFPVLKAFQEYIDAEQAKARKRMFGLSIFFIVLLVVVVVTFTIIMTSVIGRNQALSDRLLDIALREKNPAQPVVNVQQPVPSPVVHPVLPTPQENPELVRLREELQREKDARQADQAKRDKEKIDSLTAALAKAQQQPVAPTPVVVTTSPQPVIQPPADSAEIVRLREELRRANEERKAEQEKRAQEKKEAEKEAFLRRQYPDYYAKEDARKAAEAARRATPPPPLPEPAPAPVPAPPAVAPVPPPAPQPTVQPAAVPNSAELNRQREALDREEESIRRKQEEEKRKAEQGKPSPSRTVPKAAPPQPKSITYFDETQPGEDPELKELLSRVPAARTPPKATTKPAPQPAARPAPQPAAKPAPKPSARPAATQQPVQKTVQTTRKTETLAIGGAAGGGSIPWLIELPVQ